uniref:hypothetical protein n=1 Tax=Alistipes shahii TaxID=328814 RepID=UPI003FEF5953
MSTNDTACLFFWLQNLRDCILLSVGENPTYFRTFATDRKQVDFGREKGVFPLVLIQVKSAAKRTVFGPEKQARKGFSTV